MNGSERVAMADDHDWDDVLIKKVPRLAELLRETGAEEIEIGDGDRMVRVRRSIGVSSTELLDDSEMKSEAAGSTVDDAVTTIESEQVGVFMAVAEGSESTPAAVGDEVEESQVIGFVDVLGTLLIVTIFTVLISTVTQIYFNDQLEVKRGEISDLDNQISTES